jgi:predicted ATP-dependent serine protease
MNPFGERFEQKFARAQDQVARKPDGYRHNASKPQEPDVANDATAALISRCAADIAPEKIEWLWPGRLALGKHICIAGEPGTGKSQSLRR